MKLTLYTLTILIIISIQTFGQNSFDCRSLLEKEIKIENIETNKTEFLNDFKQLIDCKYEPIDYQILYGPKPDQPLIIMMAVMLGLNSVSESKKITFRDLDSLISGFKDSEEYKHARGIVETSNILANKRVSVNEWQNDSLLLIKLNFDIESISIIKNLVITQEKNNPTYAELLSSNASIIFPSKQEDNKNVDTIKEIVPDYMMKCTKNLYAYNDYSLAKRKSKETSKPLLLYFTCQGCTNSREFENNVLIEREIENTIKDNFIFVQFYVDDRSLLPEEKVAYSDVLERKLKYQGDIGMEIEIRDFHQNSQPLFVIVDIEGNEVNRIGYVLDIVRFKNFLLGQKK